MSEEDSDVAPMSPLVDAPTPEDIQKIEKQKVEKAVRFASSPSASEDELSGTEKSKKTTTQTGPILKQKKPEQTEATVTSPGRQKKVITYKGVKVQSDEEEEDEQEEAAKRSVKSSDKEDSYDSAEEYFNQQRKLIKKKLIGN